MGEVVKWFVQYKVLSCDDGGKDSACKMDDSDLRLCNILWGKHISLLRRCCRIFSYRFTRNFET